MNKPAPPTYSGPAPVRVLEPGTSGEDLLTKAQLDKKRALYLRIAAANARKNQRSQWSGPNRIAHAPKKRKP